MSGQAEPGDRQSVESLWEETLVDRYGVDDEDASDYTNFMFGNPVFVAKNPDPDTAVVTIDQLLDRFQPWGFAADNLVDNDDRVDDETVRRLRDEREDFGRDVAVLGGDFDPENDTDLEDDSYDSLEAAVGETFDLDGEARTAVVEAAERVGRDDWQETKEELVVAVAEGVDGERPGPMSVRAGSVSRRGGDEEESEEERIIDQEEDKAEALREEADGEGSETEEEGFGAQ